MKKLIAFLLIVALVMCVTPAFAQSKARPPGDGGFFTKFFNGLLGDSWAKGATGAKDITPEQTKEQAEKQRKKISKPQF